MKSMLSVALLLLFLGSDTLAQPARGGPGPSGEPLSIEEIAERLDLTDEQRPRVEEILSSQRAKMMALRDRRDGGELDRTELREEMLRIRDEGQDALAEVLSDEQLDELEALREERRSERRGRGFRGPPDGQAPRR